MLRIEMIRIFYTPSGEGKVIAIRRGLKARWYRYTPRRGNVQLSGDMWQRSHVSDVGRQEVITYRRIKPLRNL